MSLINTNINNTKNFAAIIYPKLYSLITYFQKYSQS